MSEIIANGNWLPYVFVFLMGLSMLIYVVLDGYDLGVGMLTPKANEEEKDIIIGSIGPFWDANETWLVLGVGLLLVAFPYAHGVILTNLYLPVAVMLLGLIFRGVAFDFRAKVPAGKKKRWNHAFFAGSLVTALAQGYMLGSYILGFEEGLGAMLFSTVVAVAVAATYCLLGAGWLIMKTEGELQKKAVRWAKYAVVGTTLGIALISLATPMASARIFDKWFALPEMLMLAPIPVFTAILLVATFILLRYLPQAKDRLSWAPFAMTVAVIILCFQGLAYSFYPYIVPEQMLIADAAAAPESLMIILVGALFVLPILIGYTIVIYRIFHGKATELRYD